MLIRLFFTYLKWPKIGLNIFFIHDFTVLSFKKPLPVLMNESFTLSPG